MFVLLTVFDLWLRTCILKISAFLFFMFGIFVLKLGSLQNLLLVRVPVLTLRCRWFNMTTLTQDWKYSQSQAKKNWRFKMGFMPKIISVTMKMGLLCSVIKMKSIESFASTFFSVSQNSLWKVHFLQNFSRPFYLSNKQSLVVPKGCIIDFKVSVVTRQISFYCFFPTLWDFSP